jgi:hypothetical protein
LWVRIRDGKIFNPKEFAESKESLVKENVEED